MAFQVVIFNGSAQQLGVSVNQGQLLALPGTSADYDWYANPLFNGVTYQPGFPAPNVLGNSGPNVIQAYIAGVPIGASPFTFSIPDHTIFTSIQIYFFFQTVQSISWLALIDGKPIGQQITLNMGHEEQSRRRNR